MKRNSKLVRAAAVAAVCAVVGAVAGIAGTAAAPSKHKAAHGARAHALKLRRFAGGPPVHVDAVVPNQAGTSFDTVTMDNGKFKSVSGDQLTITEGTDKATYKTVTITVPSNAKVRRNGQTATLADLKDGDEVHVVQGPRGTFVGANDAQHRPFGRFHPGGRHRGFGPPPGGPGPDGPPPMDGGM